MGHIVLPCSVIPTFTFRLISWQQFHTFNQNILWIHVRRRNTQAKITLPLRPRFQSPFESWYWERSIKKCNSYPLYRVGVIYIVWFIFALSNSLKWCVYSQGLHSEYKQHFKELDKANTKINTFWFVFSEINIVLYHINRH